MTRTAIRPTPAAVACCLPSLRTPMERQEAEAMAMALKAVADPARIQLLALLKAAPRHEACVCDLTEPLGLSQPTVSHHLRVLAEAGLVTRERRGSWAWFTLVPSRLKELQRFFA